MTITWRDFSTRTNRFCSEDVNSYEVLVHKEDRVLYAIDKLIELIDQVQNQPKIKKQLLDIKGIIVNDLKFVLMYARYADICADDPSVVEFLDAEYPNYVEYGDLTPSRHLRQ